jgi:GTP cyclohydrolase II
MAPSDPDVHIRAEINLPIDLGGGYRPTGKIISFNGLSDGREHVAVVFGDITGEAPVTRLHSECLTGDVFGSIRCDCGAQLSESMRSISETGGIVLYLRQEGRGIGLYNKLDAYRLQDTGLDTFAANRALSFADDLRDYTSSAEMLRALGVTTIRLLSNSPDKYRQLVEHGIRIAQVIPTGVFATDFNRGYLRSKVEYHGHSIQMSQEAR